MLNSTDEVIDALGGTSKVANLAGVIPQAVSNWRAAGSFPPDTYVLLKAALKKNGKSAPDSLWRMKAGAAA